MGNMTQSKNNAPSPKRKMSEMISEMAAGFLWVGNTLEERQNRLNAGKRPANRIFNRDGGMVTMPA